MAHLTSKAPGRINIIGEHTDYNDGLVLPAAIDLCTTFKFWTRGDNQVIIKAADKNEILTFDIHDTITAANDWKNYVLGVFVEMKRAGVNIGGFEARFSGDIPIGGGLSSSAALACSLAVGLNALYKGGLDQWQLIKICQQAERRFSGTNCGIMDQFASIMGKQEHAMLLDCRSQTFDYIPIQTLEYDFLLLNTQVHHQLATSEYNTRREECLLALEMLQKTTDMTSLRDLEALDWPFLIKQLPAVLQNRCEHIVKENERTKLAAVALQKGNTNVLGKLMYASHQSLSSLYEVSCPALDFLVHYCQNLPYVAGSRMMGGGFGGCTLNLIHPSYKNQFIEIIAEAYLKTFGIALSPIEVQVGNGATVY